MVILDFCSALYGEYEKLYIFFVLVVGSGAAWQLFTALEKHRVLIRRTLSEYVWSFVLLVPLFLTLAPIELFVGIRSGSRSAVAIFTGGIAIQALWISGAVAYLRKLSKRLKIQDRVPPIQVASLLDTSDLPASLHD